MTTRRDFLARLTLTATGLLVADDALQLLADMAKPRKRYVPGTTFRHRWVENQHGRSYSITFNFSPGHISYSIDRFALVDPQPTGWHPNEPEQAFKRTINFLA